VAKLVETRSRVRFPIVIGIIYWQNPAGRTAALSSTQPLIHTIIRNISYRVKAAGAETITSSCADYLDIWETKPLGALRCCPDSTIHLPFIML
jgi:hypothetical protein